LIVEDDPGVLEVMTFLLERRYDVLTATSAGAALDLIALPDDKHIYIAFFSIISACMRSKQDYAVYFSSIFCFYPL